MFTKLKTSKNNQKCNKKVNIFNKLLKISLQFVYFFDIIMTNIVCTYRIKGVSMKKNSKGFTLTELVISMTLSVLILGIVSSMLVIIKNNMTMTSDNGNRIREYSKVEKFLNNWFSTFSSDDYVLVEPVQDDISASIRFKLKPDDPSQPEDIFFYEFTWHRDSNKFTCTMPTGEETLNVGTITDAMFTVNEQNNLIKLSLVYVETEDVKDRNPNETIDREITTYTILLNYYF